MKNKEIQSLRNLFSEFGWEKTPDEINNDPESIKKLEEIKLKFKRIQPHIEELKNKMDFGVIDLSEFAIEMSSRLNKTITEDMCRHFLLMNEVFDCEQ